MNSIQRLVILVSATVFVFALTGCTDMSKRDPNTAAGAGIGGVAGAGLTGDSAGGAADNQADKKK